MKEMLSQTNFNFNNKVCLELGPGNSYISAYNFLLNGAKKIIMVDKYPRYIRTRKQQKYFTAELDYIKKEYNLKKLFFINNNKISGDYIEFISQDITDIEMKNKVDFIYSTSVFEHIRDVKGNIQKLSRIIKKNGLMHHSIDLRDHYNFNKPFLFYKYSDNIWNTYLTKCGISYTNRIRFDDYIRMFNDAGFKIIKMETEKQELGNIKINSQFRKRNDLGVTGLKILLQKVGDEK